VADSAAVPSVDAGSLVGVIAIDDAVASWDALAAALEAQRTCSVLHLQWTRTAELDLGPRTDAADEVLETLRSPRHVVVVTWQGSVAMSALRLGLASDVVLCADDAVIDASASMDELPYTGVTDRSAARVGLAWLGWAGPVTVAEAIAAGWVDRVVPSAQLDTAATSVVTSIARRGRGVNAELKALLAQTRPGAEQRRAERDARQRLQSELNGDDARDP
jgi:enoyl-CoA hydratase/carnithine racemase